MNGHSDVMGSFRRTGNFPLDSDYIFLSFDDLKSFYSDPLNKTTLHHGLLKVVVNDEELTLYWVIEEEGELIFHKLIEDFDIEHIKELLDLVEKDINNIIGSEDPLPEGLENLKNLGLAIIDLRLATGDLKDELKATVGTENEDIIEYLKTLDYLNLTLVSEALHKFLDTVDETDTSINTFPELKEFLRGFEYTHNLYECFVDFWKAIEGDPTPNTQFRTLRGILDFVEALASASKNRDDNLLSELNQTQIGVGLDGSGLYSADKETHYLQDATSVMNALRTLDGLIYNAVQSFVLQASNKDIVPLEITPTDNGYIIGASLNLSNTLGNQLTKKSDGLYLNAKVEYDAGTITFKINDSIVSLFNIGISSVVKLGYYNPDNEELVLEFNTQDGNGLIIRIPVGSLIREWVVDNPTNKVVEFTKEAVINGPDKLSADVRISLRSHNILLKEGNALYVEGTSDAITYNSLTLTSVILDIINKATSTSTKIDDEIANRKDEDNNIKNTITLEVSKLNNAIVAEQSARETADNDIKNLITTNSNSIKTVSDKVDDVQSNLATEILDRKDSILSLRDDFERETDIISNNLTDINSKINTNTSNITALDLKLDNSINTSKSYTDTEILKEQNRATLAETNLSNKINSITLNKLDTSEAGYRDTYYLSVDGTLVGSKINIPEDKVVKSATIKEVTSINDPYLDAKVGDKYIEFTFEGSSNNLYLPVNDIVIKYKEGNGITISADNFISAKVFINDKYLENSTDGIKTKGIDDAIAVAKQEVITLIDDKAPINSPILTGVPQVEVSPDSNDSSLRIPSTNWVNARIKELLLNPESYWLKLSE